MAEIKPFAALRYSELGGDISKNVCPPYDIISDSERTLLLSMSEYNMVQLELPRGDHPYESAAQKLCEMKSAGVLKNDDEPRMYIYEEEFSAYSQVKKIKGLYSRVRLTDFSEGIVLPHEETLSKAKADRFELMSTTFCNFSAIYSMYVDEEKLIRNRIDALSAGKPCVEFVDSEGITQRLWCIKDAEDIEFLERAFSDKKLYIADGHHRYETALNFKKKLIDEGVIASDTHPGNYCMMFLADIDHEGLVVFPTHRMLKNLRGFNSEEKLEKMSKYFDVEKKNCPKCLEKALCENANKNAFGYFDGEGAYLLTLKDTEEARAALCEMLDGKSEAYRGLDVSVLHSLILEKLFGIDKENMANQVNLNYTRSYDEAIEKVKNGQYNCSFLLNPTKVRQIKDVAQAGEKMPQKSTYFFPKLITGLVINELRGE